MRTLLLATALILGQWLTLAHANEHLAPAQELSCEVCLHAERFSGALAFAAPRLALAAHSCETPEALPEPAAPRREAANCSIRGPPEPSFPY